MSRRSKGGGWLSRRRRGGGRRAFTLVELLVCLGILGVLMSLLLPTLSGARHQARRVKCLANVRALTVAWLQYAQANRGRLCGAVAGAVDRPGFHDWVAHGPDEQALRDGVLWPLVADAAVYRCPADDVNACHTYALNSWLHGEGPPARGELAVALSLSRLRQPSETFVFVERVDRVGCNDKSFVVLPFPQEDWIDRPAAHLHGRAGIVSFADGHAAAWQWQTPGEWHNRGANPSGEIRVDLDLRQIQRWIGHGPYPGAPGEAGQVHDTSGG